MSSRCRFCSRSSSAPSVYGVLCRDGELFGVHLRFRQFLLAVRQLAVQALNFVIERLNGAGCRKRIQVREVR